MKGIHGLVVATVLGILGAALNLLYLQNKSKAVETVSFLGTAEEAKLEPGKPIKEADLAEVKVPVKYAEDMKNYFLLYKDRTTLKGMTPNRSYSGTQLLRREDFRTPPGTLAWQNSNQKLWWVTVSSQHIIPTMLNPGDKIDFLIPAAPDQLRSGNVEEAIEIIGPFTVASVGTRVASADVARANRMSSGPANTIGIFVDTEKDTSGQERLVGNAMKLQLRISSGAARSMSVQLHSRL